MNTQTGCQYYMAAGDAKLALMVLPVNDHLTELLNQVRAGNRDAESELAPLIYQELRRVARLNMRGERPNHTLQVTGLVNEAYIRLMRPTDKKWTDRAHFFAVAANVMRRILVDHARNRKSAKRGGGTVAVSLDVGIPPNVGARESWDRILDLNDALSQLGEVDQRSARVIELRFFGGLENAEIAELLGLTTRTIRRDLGFAQAWLYGRIAESYGKVSSGKKEMSTSPPSSR
jgi:RNA polymerase sigma-70 factor, ECF subfamily